jgi:hypothetical protein
MYQPSSGGLLPALFRCARLAGQNLGRPVTLPGWCEKNGSGAGMTCKMRLNQPEEDDALFLYAFESEAIYLLFPYVRELWEAGFPDALPVEKRRRLMRYYRSCLQRHLYANGPTQTLLSKATQSSGTVESLMEEFPDARFITIIRHPYKSVASHVSLFVPVWQAHSPDIAGDGPVAKATPTGGGVVQHLFASGQDRSGALSWHRLPGLVPAAVMNRPTRTSAGP